MAFYWKDKAKGSGQQMGVIAQDVEKVFPQLVVTNDNGFKSVNYPGLVAPLIEAVKELKADNDKLREADEALRADVKALKQRFEQLERNQPRRNAMQ